MSTIITVTTIMSMYMNLTTNVENSKYCYNADIEDGKVMAMVVYDKDGESLNAKLKRLYTYDEQGRLTMRETLVWNNDKQTWTKNSCLSYNYDTEGYTVEKRLWDETKNDYAMAKNYSRYTILMDNVLAVNNYKYDNDSCSYVLIDKMLMLTDNTGRLMAME